MNIVCEELDEMSMREKQMKHTMELVKIYIANGGKKYFKDV